MTTIVTVLYTVSDELARLLGHPSLSYLTKYRLLCQALPSGEATLFSAHVPAVERPVTVEFELEGEQHGG